MIKIKDGMSLLAVQNIFNGAFPYLKLGFFRTTGTESGAKKEVFLKQDLLLRRSTGDYNMPECVIDSNMSVREVEQLFLLHFGLLVQIFRKSGRSWLETKLTEDWSLEKQNCEGFELSTII